MDENMEITQEMVDASWDESDAPGTPEEEAPAPADQPAGAENEGGEGRKPEEEAPKADQPELFTIKNRDEQRQVTREELVSMAQKGWDYDKVREERDQLRQYRSETDPAMELIRRYAQRSNMSVSDYLDYCRKQELIATGMSEKDAAQKVSFDKERAELDRQRAELDARDQQANDARRMAQEQAKARQKDIESFYKAYPKVDPKSIPQEVWDAVKSGDTLTNAYTRYENQRLQAEIAALKQNNKNKSQSPGSLGGNVDKEMDEIDRIWAEED